MEQENQKSGGLQARMGLDPTINSRERPEYLVMSLSMQWSLLFFAALQTIVADATTLKEADLTEETPRRKMLGLLTNAPIKVTMDRVDVGMLRKEQVALVLSTEVHPTRRLWLTYDQVKRDGTEKWDQYLVLMYANHEPDEYCDVRQEGILFRYGIINREFRTNQWMVEIAMDVLRKLYQADPYVPLVE